MIFRLLLASLLLASTTAFVLPGAPVTSLAVAASTTRVVESPVMGRGDKRTAKGKRKAKSFGNSRPRNSELRKKKEAASQSEE